MKGDFSRLTFDPARQYTSVLMQQGRVQLDADWNEQADIFQHYLRTLAADLIGPFGAPPEKDGTPGLGFKLVPRRKADGTLSGLFLLPGRYYVDGIAAENPREWPLPEPDKNIRYLLYLDVWERHVTYLQDDLLREVALLGPDTATRSKVVWLARTANKTPDKVDIPEDLTCRTIRREWSRWVEQWQSPRRGQLKARARPGKPDDTDPCLASPEARYRGENQLYRVEIHTGGLLGTATYKWSADNGSVVFPVRELAADAASQKTTATLEHLGSGDGAGLVQDDWVEVVDGEGDLRDGTDPLLQVESVDADRRQVVLKNEPPSGLGKPLMLRRWDHRRGIARKELLPSGVFPVVEGKWLDLEDGVQIWFEKSEAGAPPNAYRRGDYWLIPARVATGDVEWPGPPEAPESLPPRGVEHHYAPLGLLTLREGTALVELTDCRTTFGSCSVSLTTGVADWQVTAEQALPGLNRPGSRPADIVVRPDKVWDSISGALWISSNPLRASKFPVGNYTFELEFDLCSRFRRPRIWFYLLADNSAEVFLNGDPKALGGKPGPKGYENPPLYFEVSGVNAATNKPWLRPEENKLRVVVHNEHVDTPTGFILHGAVEDDCPCR